MEENVKMIYPSYIDKFQCIGGKCEDTCCKEWDIDVDKETFKKYHKVTDEAMKKILFIDFAIAVALAILLGGCWQEMEAQPTPNGDGSKITVCKVDFTFMYDTNEGQYIEYYNQSKTGSAKVKLHKLAKEGDYEGTPFDSACLKPDATEKHGKTLDNEMRVMVEVWWGEQCSPDNLLEPCSENGAVILVKHTPPTRP